MDSNHTLLTESRLLVLLSLPGGHLSEVHISHQSAAALGWGWGQGLRASGWGDARVGEGAGQGGEGTTRTHWATFPGSGSSREGGRAQMPVCLRTVTKLVVLALTQVWRD